MILRLSALLAALVAFCAPASAACTGTGNCVLLDNGTVGDVPSPTSSTLGGVKSATAISHQFLTAISTSGIVSQAQPVAADVTFTQDGTGAIARTVDAKVKDYAVNVKDFGASGSVATTTGSISSGGSALTLASAQDFANGQAVRINGAGATFAVNPPTALTVAPQGSAGATTYQYQVAALDCYGGVGAALTAVSISNGNATLSTSNYNKVSWTAPVSGAGPCGYAVYGKTAGSMTLLSVVRGSITWNDYGFTTVPNPDWLPSAPQGAALNDWLLTTISSGGGTTSLVLAASATHTVSGATVSHDDTASIQAAIGALPARGGIVGLSTGTYNITSTINIGNGSGSTASTVNGISLLGLASRGGANGISGTPSIYPVDIKCLWYGVCISVNGPINGWGFSNISIDLGSMASTNSFGLAVYSASYGNVSGLLVTGSYYFSIFETVNSATTPASQNSWAGIQVWMSGNAINANGIGISGISSADVYNELWRDVVVIPSIASQTALKVGSADTIRFENITINPAGATGILFDYTLNSSWPANIMFDGLEIWSNSVTNVGSPSLSGINTNKVFGFSRINGASVPYVANLAVMDYYTSGGNAPTVTAGCNGAGSSVATGSTNSSGTITGQTAAATGCTITFAVPSTWTNAPVCVVTGLTGQPINTFATSTTLAITFASTASYKFSYFCQGS